MFPDVGIVREVQQELDTVIEEGVVNIVNLLKNQVSLLSLSQDCNLRIFAAVGRISDPDPRFAMDLDSDSWLLEKEKTQAWLLEIRKFFQNWHPKQNLSK